MAERKKEEKWQNTLLSFTFYLTIYIFKEKVEKKSQCVVI